MDFSRRGAEARSKVVAGSVWESRIKFDEVRGGIKVFNGDEGSTECEASAPANLQSGQIGRRKTWKSEGADGFAIFEKNLILMAEDSYGDEDEETRKTIIPGRRLRSEGSPIEVRKRIHEPAKRMPESGERTEKNAVLRKKTDPSRKSESKMVRKEETAKEIERNRGEIGKNGSDKVCTEFDECSRVTEKRVPQVSGEEEDEEGEMEKERFDIKEINLPERKKMVNEVKKCHQIAGKSPPTKKLAAATATGEIFPGNKQKLHSLTDLIMWRDIIRSGIVFGTGICIIIFSLFAKNIQISFITVMSYLGLLCLAVIFLHRSFICREADDREDENYMVGEEEAIRFAKLLLPYINELQMNVRALFRGDPATTMKLAVALFALAKCGSFITIWNVLKWGFVGVFTVPKFCSVYSSRVITHGEYWMKQFGNSWKLCDHKKAIAFAIFFAVWNFSSTVARIWAVFVLVVSLRYYQQSPAKGGWAEDEDETGNEQSKSSKRGAKVSNGNPFVVSLKSKHKKEY